MNILGISAYYHDSAAAVIHNGEILAAAQEERFTRIKHDASLTLTDKLYTLRSDIPAVAHVGFSARIQSVRRDTNEKYYLLLQKFKELTGYGIIVNTSFNVRGEPIFCSPEEAYICFMNTEMDYLVMGNYIFDKKVQTDWIQTDEYKKNY